MSLVNGISVDDVDVSVEVDISVSVKIVDINVVNGVVISVSVLVDVMLLSFEVIVMFDDVVLSIVDNVVVISFGHIS